MDDNDGENPESGLSDALALVSDNVSDTSDSEYVSSDSTEEFIHRMGNAAIGGVVDDDARHNGGAEQTSADQQQTTAAQDHTGEPIESFNLDLPPEHLYLGSNLESVPGRVILTEGSYVTLPLLPRSYGTLIPGQTFPLTVRDHARARMLRKCVETDHTFGCIAARYQSSVDSTEDLIGTTAEIYEFSDNVSVICIKAKARQRFRLIKTMRSDAGYYIGEVQILPEIKLSHPLLQIQSNSLNRIRSTQKESCRKRDALLTTWPIWVYNQYDQEKLVQRVDKELGFLKQGLRQASGKITMPREPTELSFWIATHLDSDERLSVIRLNSPIQRLRWQLSLMNKCQVYSSKLYSCRSCQAQVGHQNDVFAMSVEGAQNTYVNMHGFLHETITLRRAQHLTLVGSRSSQYSWFPGYAWRIAVCENCQRHIGWQFTAQKRRMNPQKFWGLSRQSLITAVPSDVQEEEPESDIPVM